jgi:excinuclease ABC subunit C
MASRPPHPDGSDRFREEQATYTVRGADQPDLAAGVAAIREVARTLKAGPGVYRMHSRTGWQTTFRSSGSPAGFSGWLPRPAA